MRIEVDTKHDSREELAALAEMLQRLSRSSAGVVVPKSVSRNIFDDPSPGVGLMGMFGDASSSSQQAQSCSSPSPAPEQPPAGGLFSIFGDATAQVAQQASSYRQSSQPESADPEKKTAAQDILDDDRIQLY
jgi:hypothetical protein